MPYTVLRWRGFYWVKVNGKSREGRGRVDQPLGSGVTEEQRQTEDGDRQGPFKRDCSECAQEVPFMVAAEDIACQDPRTGQCRCLSTKIPLFLL